MLAAGNREQSKKVEVLNLGLGTVGLWADRGTAGIWCWSWLLPSLKLTGWFSGQLACAQCPGSSRACHSATPSPFLVLRAQGSRRLQTTRRTCPGLDLPPQSCVPSWALVLSTSSRAPSYSPSDPSRLGALTPVPKLRTSLGTG